MEYHCHSKVGFYQGLRVWSRLVCQPDRCKQLQEVCGVDVPQSIITKKIPKEGALHHSQTIGLQTNHSMIHVHNAFHTYTNLDVSKCLSIGRLVRGLSIRAPNKVLEVVKEPRHSSTTIDALPH
jgi:hypothetical protein